MGHGERHVADKRFRRVAVDEVECLVRAEVHDVARLAHHSTVLFEGRIEVLAPMPRTVPVVLVEPACHQVVRPLAAVVPLAECSRHIARRVKSVGDGAFIQIEPFQSGGNSAHAAARMIAPSQELSPRRNTDRTHEEPVERHAAALTHQSLTRKRRCLVEDAW